MILIKMYLNSRPQLLPLRRRHFLLTIGILCLHFFFSTDKQTTFFSFVWIYFYLYFILHLTTLGFPLIITIGPCYTAFKCVLSRTYITDT